MILSLHTGESTGYQLTVISQQVAMVTNSKETEKLCHI
jgi:hypothetical protein